MLFLLLEGRVVVLFVDEEGDSGRVDGVEVRSELYFGERVGDLESLLRSCWLSLMTSLLLRSVQF